SRYRTCRNPGRGFKPFKVLCRIFRAIVACRALSLLPVHGEKAGMSGLAGIRAGQSPKPLTPTLSPLKRGEGELHVLFELNVPRISRRKLRPADERCAIRGGPFGGRLAIRRPGKASAGGCEGHMIAVQFAHDSDHTVDRL